MAPDPTRAPSAPAAPPAPPRGVPPVVPAPAPTPIRKPPLERPDPDGAPLPTPPDAVATTIEELPAGFWDDEDAEPNSGPHAEVAAPEPTPPTAHAADAPTAVRDAPPALATLQGMALLQAVFPGRVVKIERPAATATKDDTAPDEPVTAELPDGVGDDLEPGDDAPPPLIPPRRNP